MTYIDVINFLMEERDEEHTTGGYDAGWILCGLNAMHKARCFICE